MAELKVKTRGNAPANKKPRVYFTCHPQDFDRSLGKICEDIFKTHDCAVYYTEDMKEVYDRQNIDTDLDRMNLFVIPVSLKLLTEPCRAVDFDLAYALEKHIPVLPVVMESGLDSLYAEKFRELQYLNPYSTDSTEISYEEKLAKFLESVLISDEMAKRVRAAFDAYIFLSYRKKDRGYANQLMRLIHSKREFRDVAIWYDEFLTPGESFKENIVKMLDDSKLFALLVTPNLLEEPGGKPNFVMDKEYPMAKEKGMDILPAEMEETDKESLRSKFEDIPDSLKPQDEEFTKRLAGAIYKIAVSENNDDPEHNFLIGLAYLEGIDVETDRERGLSLITCAAEAELPEAMLRLFYMYCDGLGVKMDYFAAKFWIERLYNLSTEKLGPRHPVTVIAMDHLANICGRLGEFERALQLYKDIYDEVYSSINAEHPGAIVTNDNMAHIYYMKGDIKKALEIRKKVYELSVKAFGEHHRETLISLDNLAVAYCDSGDCPEALRRGREVYELFCQECGPEEADTLTALHNLARSYSKYNNHKKALANFRKAYALRAKTLGKKHPDTVVALGSFARAFKNVKEHQKARMLFEKAYELNCEVLTEEHPNTVVALSELATINYMCRNKQLALELAEKAYNTGYRKHGGTHTATIVALNNFAAINKVENNRKKATELYTKLYEFVSEAFGAGHEMALEARIELEELKRTK